MTKVITPLLQAPPFKDLAPFRGEGKAGLRVPTRGSIVVEVVGGAS